MGFVSSEQNFDFNFKFYRNGKVPIELIKAPYQWMNQLKTYPIQPIEITIPSCTFTNSLFAIDKSEFIVIVPVNSCTWKYYVTRNFGLEYHKSTQIHMLAIAAAQTRFASKIYYHWSAVKRMRLAKPLLLKMANCFRITCNILGISQNRSEISVSVCIFNSSLFIEYIQTLYQII